MKHPFLIALFAVLCYSINAQTTVTFKPGPTTGQDAFIETLYGCTPSGYQGPLEQMNFGSHDQICYLAWTFTNINCNTGKTRSLLRFTGLNSLPAGVFILSATLNLYGVQSSGLVNGNTGQNSGWVNRVTSNWDENTVTWDNQPTFTSSNQVAIPQSTQQWNWDLSLDVTDLVHDILYFGNNYGFMLQLQDEIKYRSVLFASSDNADSSKWPSLTVTYCDSRFTYCSSSNDPYTYNFQSVSNNIGTWEIYQGSQTIATGNGATFQYTFNPGEYQVCFVGDEGKCSRCIRICILDNKVVEQPFLQKQEIRTDDDNTRSDSKKMTSENVSISPNPTQKQWKVDLETEDAGKVSVILLSLNGKKVKTFSKDVKSGKNSFYLDVKNLPTGIYILQLKKGTYTVRKKVLKE